MKRKIIKLVVVAVTLSAAACGRVDVPDEHASSPAEVQASQPAPPAPREHPDPSDRLGQVPVRPSIAAPGLEVSGVGVFPAGLRMRVITGLMSCGFEETGRADTVSADGAFSVRVPQKPSYGMNAVLVWIDRDQDGACSPGDTTAQVSLPYGGGAPTGLDLATAREAGCWWFN